MRYAEREIILKGKSCTGRSIPNHCAAIYAVLYSINIHIHIHVYRPQALIYYTFVDYMFVFVGAAFLHLKSEEPEPA